MDKWRKAMESRKDWIYRRAEEDGRLEREEGFGKGMGGRLVNRCCGRCNSMSHASRISFVCRIKDKIPEQRHRCSCCRSFLIPAGLTCFCCCCCCCCCCRCCPLLLLLLLSLPYYTYLQCSLLSPPCFHLPCCQSSSCNCCHLGGLVNGMSVRWHFCVQTCIIRSTDQVKGTSSGSPWGIVVLDRCIFSLSIIH